MMGETIFVDPLLKEVAEVFLRNNKKAYLVGGAVRDILRKQTASDWDIATDALAEDVCSMFRRVIPTGIKHGTVTVLYKKHSIEVTTFRSEASYSDGRRPDAVAWSASIEEDLSRRDFTMNAIAAELPSGRIIDPYHGIDDIKKKLIRCVGKAADRFSEDGLRPMRALRFASVLGFDVESEIITAITQSLHITEKVSAERIRDEFEKILSSKKPSIALNLMHKTGLLRLLLPELADCANVEQKGHHHFDVLTHSVLACNYAAKIGSSVELRLAALLHDIGKPCVAKLDDSGVWTFYNHEKHSSDIARVLLTRLRFPNIVIDNVVHFIAEHMFHYEAVWSDAAVRRFVARVGEENISALFQLRMADAYATAAVTPGSDLLLPFKQRIDDVLEKSRAISVKNLAVNGSDLIAKGFSACPHLGNVLNKLLDAVMEDPSLNTKEKLLEIALHQFLEEQVQI